MSRVSDPVREHLVRVLEWDDAHAGFDKAVSGLTANARGVRPPGFDHSVWELVEHIRLAQADILDFCLNPEYQHTKSWPDDYWPPTPAPAAEEVWAASLSSYGLDRSRLQQLARETPDLAALVPTGRGTQTYLRALLLTADHTAYHVGQIVAVRRALDVWG
jgi:uncharacterized damage-inducible protein DinB